VKNKSSDNLNLPELRKAMNNGNKNAQNMQPDIATQHIVMPAVNATQAIEAWKQYQELKGAIIDKAVDIQTIAGKEFLKKSYWRKIATFFNLSVEVVEEKWEQLGKTLVWHFTCKATAPNARFAVGTGSCDAYEKAQLKNGEYIFYNKFKGAYESAQPNSIHNIRSTAETRAFNRAVSNLVAGGEVSAEEVNTAQILDDISETTPDEEVKDNPAFCKIHNKALKERRNAKGFWYDHRWQENGEWKKCNGLPTGDEIDGEGDTMAEYPTNGDI